jgi:hypothetical protein
MFADHQNTIVQFKRRLELKDIAGKVITAILSKSTNIISGDIMGKFMQAV